MLSLPEVRVCVAARLPTGDGRLRLGLLWRAGAAADPTADWLRVSWWGDDICLLLQTKQAFTGSRQQRLNGKIRRTTGIRSEAFVIFFL